MTATLQPFPTDWNTALVIVAHPDDPEYGMAAAVARWTSEGRRVIYELATSGEAGIEGMSPAETGPVREAEQIASAKVVGVDEVAFWGFPDSELRNTPELRAKITEVIERYRPQVIMSLYGGPAWAPDRPNQSDHIECSAAVLQAYDELADPPAYLFENGPNPTHALDVTGFTDTAVASLAAHEKYLSVLDPATPVLEQARNQVSWSNPPRDDFAGEAVAAFELKRRR